MRRRLLAGAAVAGLAMAVAPAASAQAPASRGCDELNGPFKDGLYEQRRGYGDFTAGEELTFIASHPAGDTYTPNLVYLYVNDVEAMRASYPGTLTYTVPTSGFYEFLWRTNDGSATWDVICTRAPDGDGDGASDGDDNCPTATTPIRPTVTTTASVMCVMPRMVGRTAPA